MRGLATIIFVGFVSILLFGIVAPAILEPVAQVFLNSEAIQSSTFGADYVDSMLRSILVWAPLIVLGSGVASAVVYYFRKERRAGRRRL